MTKDPDQRFQTAPEVERALAAGTAAPYTAAPAGRRRASRPFKLLLGGGVLALLVVLVGTGAWLLHGVLTPQVGSDPINKENKNHAHGTTLPTPQELAARPAA